MLASELGVPIESLTDYRPRFNVLQRTHTGSSERGMRIARYCPPSGASSTSG